MRPEDWLKPPKEWSTEQWDYVGYAIEAVFGLYVFISGGIIAQVILLLFAFFALLAWSAYRNDGMRL